jgi:prepilin-type N-terminal cleavage/methylation domain-containing protein
MSNPGQKNNQKAFTLVEILVVITVIGLLSSIIFAITSGTREQGRIAKGLYLSQHLHNSLGSYVAGIWNLDEGSGTTTNDTSGWGNNGTLVNSPTWRCASVDTDYTPSAQGCSLEFDGINNRVDIGTGRAGETGTVLFWFKANPSATQDYSGIVVQANGFGHTDQNWGFATSRGEDTYTVLFRSNITLGQYEWTNRTVKSSVPVDEWHMFGATWYYDTDEGYTYAATIYDGTRNNFTKQGHSGSIGIQRPVRIGGYTDRKVSGLIDEVRIYATAFTSSQIESRYYAGLDKLLVKGQITQKEYQERTKNI